MLNAAFVLASLDLISRLHLASFIIMLNKTDEMFHILRLFLINHNLYRGWLPPDYHHLIS